MFYFQEYEIKDFSPDKVEFSIRKFSAKKYSSLDLLTSSTYIKGDKKFLGIESESYLDFTRIRTPLEQIFPKVIVRFDKSSFNVYKLRLSLLSFLIVLFLLSALLVNIINSLNQNRIESDIIPVLTLALLYFALLKLEIGITRRNLRRILMKSGVEVY